MVGGTVTVKVGPLTVRPSAVTLTGPVVVPAATEAVIRVVLFTVKEAAWTPLNFTAVTDTKSAP